MKRRKEELIQELNYQISCNQELSSKLLVAEEQLATSKQLGDHYEKRILAVEEQLADSEIRMEYYEKRIRAVSLILVRIYAEAPLPHKGNVAIALTILGVHDPISIVEQLIEAVEIQREQLAKKAKED